MFSHRPEISVSQPLVYDICVAGVLDPDFSDYMRSMTITRETDSDGAPVTRVRGMCPDHAALVGVLTTLGNLGLVVLSVRCLGGPGDEARAQDVSSEALASADVVSGTPAMAPLAAAATAGIAAPAIVGSSRSFLTRLRPGGHGRIGAGTGLIVGGLLTAGGPPCILAGAIAGAIIGGLAASLMGRTLQAEQ